MDSPLDRRTLGHMSPPCEDGVSLRDYFAATSLPPIIDHFSSGNRERSWLEVAEICYAVADAMLKARESK